MNNDCIESGKIPPVKIIAWYAVPLSLEDIAHLKGTNEDWMREPNRIQDEEEGTWYTLLSPVEGTQFIPDNIEIIHVAQRFTQGNYPIKNLTGATLVKVGSLLNMVEESVI